MAARIACRIVLLAALLAGAAVPAQALPDGFLSPDTLNLAPWAQGGNAVCAGDHPSAGPTHTLWSGLCAAGLMEGVGTLTIESAPGLRATLIGRFVHGVAEGRVQISQGTALFDGEFHDNRPNGEGIWFDGRGTRTRATLRSGGFVGSATETSPDGSRREVTYTFGVVRGLIVRTLADGTRIETDLGDRGRLRSLMTFADGSYLRTRFVNDEETGIADYRDAGGHLYTGPFVPAQTVPANQDMPPMPELSRRLHEEGVVELSFIVTPQGRVADLGLHLSSNVDRLDHASLAAVAQWRYRPAMVGDHPVAAFVIVAFVFSRKDWIAQGRAVD